MIANRIMQAAGLGSNLSAIPARNYEVLSDIAKTLARDPKAKLANASGLPIPEAFRDLQQDYAYAGSGYDTPSERIRRVLSDRKDSGSQTSSLDGSTSAVPDRQYSFGDRFGNWGSTPAAIAPLVAPDRPDSLDNRFGNWDTAPAWDAGSSDSPVLRALQNYKRSAASPPFEPNEAPPPPERTPLLGIVSGMPMSFSPFPLPLGGLSDNSDRTGNGNLFDFLAGLAPRNPSPAPPASGTGGMPVRILGRSIAGQPQGSVFDTGTPAAPLSPSEHANFSVGLLGRLAAVAGLDPQNPGQPAPHPLDEELRGFYRDDPVQPWFVQRQR